VLGLAEPALKIAEEWLRPVLKIRAQAEACVTGCLPAGSRRYRGCRYAAEASRVWPSVRMRSGTRRSSRTMRNQERTFSV
jgi:hypothetical protein